MRVAIDAHMLGDRSGGNESHYKNLINHMKVPPDIELFLFVRPDYDMSDITITCKCIRFQANDPIKRNFVEIPAMVKKYEIEVLHMQYFIPFRRPCKTIVTIHDISFEHYKNIFTKKDYFVQRLLIPYAARHSDLIFTVSEFSKKDIMEHYRINQGKIFVTYNGISEKFRRVRCGEEEKRAFLDKFGIHEPYILCVGNLQPRKNLNRLMRAYEEFCSRINQNVKLVIAGAKAWMFEEIFRDIKDSDLQENVVLPGYVTEEELIKLYSFACFFIYPSFFEGFGLPVLEAMACGTPVATSDVTSLPEVAGEAAVLFDPFDEHDICEKMYRLYKDEELRDRLCVKAQEQIKKFDWKKIASETVDQYRKLGQGNQDKPLGQTGDKRR